MSVGYTTTDNSANTASSVANATRAVVQEFLTARLAGDTGRLIELFADEVDWLLAKNPAAPWIRRRSTAAECAAQFTELMEYTVPEHARASIDTFLVDGTDAVLMGDISGTVRATGKSFEGPFALHLTVHSLSRAAGSPGTASTKTACRLPRPAPRNGWPGQDAFQPPTAWMPVTGRKTAVPHVRNGFSGHPSEILHRPKRVCLKTASGCDRTVPYGTERRNP
ncbi:nuclear transport factor 2 family protein [Chelativorans sp. M5D2P16]|uniref:nuclear transport factor 2 family protein n=1 Tax=Chelativorans sp. M5D2P16 TaxID=3095678 RepID=UPI003A0FC631